MTASSEVNVLYENEKHWANIKDAYLIKPIVGGIGRILVLEDPFKSKYECTTCNGKGHTEEICKWCLGTKFEKGKEENGYCRDCTVGEGIGKLSGKTLGKTLCTTCRGTGGLLATPEDNQKRPTMGRVLAISETGIQEVKVNDKVIYTTYTGSPFEFMDCPLRVIMERDLLGLVKQLKSNVEGLTEGSFVDLDNTGTPHV